MKVKIGKYPAHRWYHNALYKWFGYSPKQSVKVRIDSWDTWNMDHTLADIILPMLIQLKETKHGAPSVDDEDVPAELQSTYAAEPGEPEIGITDSSWFERWDWVLDEMIYAFDCKANKEDILMRLENLEEARKEQNRISNGFRLFGKYFENLWD